MLSRNSSSQQRRTRQAARQKAENNLLIEETGGLKKKSFLDTPQTLVMTEDRKTNLVFQKLKVGWADKKYQGQIK